jgi:hypothetical protein
MWARKRERNFNNRLVVSNNLCIFATAYNTMVIHPAGRTSDAQLYQPGIFYANWGML